MPEVQGVIHFDKQIPSMDSSLFSHTSIGDLIEQWDEKTKEDILQQVFPSTDNDPTPDQDFSDDDRERQLEHISVVFRCLECAILLFGWSNIKTHHCSYIKRSGLKVVLPSSESKDHLEVAPSPQPSIKFVPGLRRELSIVEQWACIVNRDGVTVRDMDTEAAECLFCYSKEEPESEGFLVILNWRKYVGVSF